MRKKTGLVLLLVLLCCVGMICFAESESETVYTLPAEIVAPSFEECGQYTNWSSANEYTYIYKVSNPEPGELEQFEISSSNMAIHYRVAAIASNERDFANFCAVPKDDHSYAMRYLQRVYENVSEKVPWATVNCYYSGSGAFQSASVMMNVDFEGKIEPCSANYNGSRWTYYDSARNEITSQELIQIVSPMISLVDMSPIQIQYEGKLDLTSFLRQEVAPHSAGEYTLPKEINAPSFAECGQYTNWTNVDSEYSYTYMVPNPEPGEITEFIVQSSDSVLIYYPSSADGPYGSEAEVFALVQDGHTYKQVSVQRKYYQLSDQIPYGYINNVYSDQGDLTQIVLLINVTLDGNETKRYNAIWHDAKWYYVDQEGNNFTVPSQELAQAFSPILSLVDMSPIQIQYEGTLDLTGYLTREITPQVVTIDIPGGVVIPSKEECEAYKEWDRVSSEEYASVFHVNQRDDLPYNVSVQFVQNQEPGVGLEMDVTGTAADPRTDKDSETKYNALQLYYLEGDSSPRTVWISTSYGKVGNQFDYAYVSMYYNSEGGNINYGFASIGINSQNLRIDYNNGEWQITEEARDLMSSDGLMEQRLAWLNAYQPKPLTLRKNATLSIYDLMVSHTILNLPNDLQEIESQAFAGVNVDKVIVPVSVQRIADDAFDDNVLLIFSDSRLEEWAKEKHPNYRIGQ